MRADRVAIRGSGVWRGVKLHHHLPEFQPLIGWDFLPGTSVLAYSDVVSCGCNCWCGAARLRSVAFDQFPEQLFYLGFGISQRNAALLGDLIHPSITAARTLMA